MKTFLLCAVCFAGFTGAALAQDATVVVPDAPDAVIVQHRSVEPDAEKKVITRSSDGCVSKTVKRTTEDGDSVAKTSTNC